MNILKELETNVKLMEMEWRSLIKNFSNNNISNMFDNIQRLGVLISNIKTFLKYLKR